jgi:hypothetical protein
VRPAAGDGSADTVAREPAGGDPDLDPSDPEENP